MAASSRTLFPECREETPFIKAIRQKKPLPGAVGGAKKWRHAYGMPIPAACRMPQAMQHWVTQVANQTALDQTGTCRAANSARIGGSQRMNISRRNRFLWF